MSEIPTFQFAIRNDLSLSSANNSEIYMPTKGTERSTGWDVRAAITNQLTIRAGAHIKIPLGFRVFAPEGWWLELRPRSSSFVKKKLHCLYGVIDEDYEGECLFACQYIPDIKCMGKDLIIEPGDAIGQIIPVQRQDMKVVRISNEDFEKKCKERNAQRGAGGFGSTDKK